MENHLCSFAMRVKDDWLYMFSFWDVLVKIAFKFRHIQLWKASQLALSTFASSWFVQTMSYIYGKYLGHKNTTRSRVNMKLQHFWLSILFAEKSFESLVLAASPCTPNNPCLFGGHCLPDGEDYTCLCPGGRGGSHCERKSKHNLTSIGDNCTKNSGRKCLFREAHIFNFVWSRIQTR